MRICVPEGCSMDDLAPLEIMDALIEEYFYSFFEWRRSKKEFLDGIKIDPLNKEYFYACFGM